MDEERRRPEEIMSVKAEEISSSTRGAEEKRRNWNGGKY